MNEELVDLIATTDAETINKFYVSENISKALIMTKVCIHTFIPLINLGDGNSIKNNIFYRQYIIKLLELIVNKEYGARSIIMGDYSYE